MNDPISWDPSLVKKFSSSNHYKLLNQLKNEVKKYPLNNKKKTLSVKSYDTENESRNISDELNSQKPLTPYNSNHSKGEIDVKSTVSFNNAKNFSIYNNSNISRQNECLISEKSKSNEDSVAPSFKDRLSQIDMK